jgi:hypothetical protein
MVEIISTAILVRRKYNPMHDWLEYERIDTFKKKGIHSVISLLCRNSIG